MDSFVEWCAANHLHLNSTKTKELVVDFRRRKSDPAPISINGVTVDVVQDYKYLGVNLDNKLNWAKNTEAVYKKGQSRLFPEEAPVIQHHAEDVQPVGCSQFHLLCCCVLG